MSSNHTRCGCFLKSEEGVWPCSGRGVSWCCVLVEVIGGVMGLDYLVQVNPWPKCTNS